MDAVLTMSGGKQAQGAEEALLTAVAAGDAQAFSMLVRAHYANGLSVARRILLSAGDAEDVVQDIFAKIWAKPDAFRLTGGRFAPWFRRVVVNRCIDQRRALKPVEAIEAAGEVADGAPLAPELLDGARKQARLDAAMAALPLRQRAAITLFYHEGLSMAEVADIMEANVKTVESLLSRGRAGLKQTLLQGEAA